MKYSLIAELHGHFESLVQTEEESGVEFWLARDLKRFWATPNRKTLSMSSRKPELLAKHQVTM